MSRLQAHTYGSMSPKATTPASLPTSTQTPKTSTSNYPRLTTTPFEKTFELRFFLFFFITSLSPEPAGGADLIRGKR